MTNTTITEKLEALRAAYRATWTRVTGQPADGLEALLAAARLGELDFNYDANLRAGDCVLLWATGEETRVERAKTLVAWSPAWGSLEVMHQAQAYASLAISDEQRAHEDERASDLGGLK